VTDEWAAFCDALAIEGLVPEAFERYRPAIAAGFELFLDALPAERTFEILGYQAALDADAGPGDRLIELARCCPVLHKLGQVIARDTRLPADLRTHLQRLETMAPSGDTDWVPGVIADELGGALPVGIALDPRPLAEASVAMVTGFVWTPPDGDPPRRGVFKVLKPGIEARLDEELEILSSIGARLDEKCEHYGLPAIAYADSFAQVRELLERETRLDQEQRHLVLARQAYAGMQRVVVPEVFPFSTPRLTAMERIDGLKVTEVDGMPAAARRSVAETMVIALLAQPIWSPDDRTPFHADPHAGNLMVTGDGRLALLDWSLVGQLSKADRIGLSQILLGAITSDASRIVDAIHGLAANGTGDAAAIERSVAAAMQRLAISLWPGLTWLTQLMDDIASTTRIRFSGDLLAFRKVLHTVNGVVADVSADCQADVVLVQSFLTRLGIEWPMRMASGPTTRAFATHFSNADLAHIGLSAPLLAWRAWLDGIASWTGGRGEPPSGGHG
jgi:ubiquinone biosynthesis protein